MLINKDKPTYEENLSQLLQTDKKQFKVAITFVTANNALFIVTKNYKFHVATSITDEGGFIQITIPLGTYEMTYEMTRNIRNKRTSRKDCY